MGALLDMCAGPRNIFIEEATEIKKKYHVVEEDKISKVRLADISKNMKIDLGKKEFLAKVFDHYAKTNPGYLTRQEFILILKHLVELDTTGGFPIEENIDGVPAKKSLLLRYETIPDEHVVRSREMENIVLESDIQAAKVKKLDKKIDRKGFTFVKNIYKAMGLKKNSDISRDDFITKFKIRFYCDALKIK
jgi:hypothetical protein